MSRSHDGSNAAADQAGTTGGSHPAPGKRTLTQAIQLRAASAPAPAVSAPPSDPPTTAAFEDPFGLHLACQVVQAAGGALAEDAHAAAGAGVAGSGGAVPHAETIQPLMPGLDLSTVRAHSGGATDRALGALGAQAYATGNDIALPTSPSVHLVAHELAHVAQQRQGVSLKGGVGTAGDSYEVQADAIADRIAAGQSAADLMPAASTGTGSSGDVQLKADPQVTTKMNIKLVGHASPKWEKTHGKNKKTLNKNLSRDRAATVEEVLRVLLSEHLAARGHATHVAVASTAVDHDDGAIEIESDSRGSDDTIKEAGGDEKSNAESLRRVNVKVTLGWHVRDSGEAMSTERQDIPEHCDPDATDDWGVTLSLSGGAGHAGVGGAFALGKIRNNLTMKTANGAFVGGGLGVGLSSPGIDLGDDFTNFKTDRPVTFHDFHNTLARLTQAGGGIGIISGSVTYLSFPMLGANSINLSGIGMGQFGFDASTNVGDFFITDNTIPGPDCTPAHTVYHDVVEEVPVEYDRTKEFEHTVLFDTQSSSLSEAEMAVLDSFAIGIAEEYEWDGT